MKSVAYIAAGIVFVAVSSGETEAVEEPPATNTSFYEEPIHIIPLEYMAQSAGDNGAVEIATVIPSEHMEYRAIEQAAKRGNSLVSEREIVMIAKGAYGEARGIESLTEQAAVIWTYFNRADAWGMSVSDVILQPGQFCYDESFPTVDDFGRDLTELAQDVADRWECEHNGEDSVGRVLPASYLWFGGDGERNYFRDAFAFSEAQIWNWSLPSPYES